MGFRCLRVERSWIERSCVERSALNGGSGLRLVGPARGGIPALANRLMPGLCPGMFRGAITSLHWGIS